MDNKAHDHLERPYITGVGALDGDCFDVNLSNGHTILLELKKLLDEPAFAAIVKSGAFCKPKTDGTRVYWDDGPSITFEELIKMLTSGGQNQQQLTEEENL
jgi:hypothetical protein